MKHLYVPPLIAVTNSLSQKKCYLTSLNAYTMRKINLFFQKDNNTDNFLWDNTHLFNSVKIDSIAWFQVEFHDVEKVVAWDKELNPFIINKNILSENMHTFDESKFWIEHVTEKEIVLSFEIKDFYAVMTENWKSLIVIKIISASDKNISSIFIIQGKLQMKFWYHKNLQNDKTMLLSFIKYIKIKP